MFWGVFWEAFGGVLEVLLWYVGRFSGSKHKGTLDSLEEQNVVIILCDMLIL